MADLEDVDALLEAPFKEQDEQEAVVKVKTEENGTKEEKRKRKEGRSRSRDKDKDDSRSSKKHKKKSKDRSRSKSKSPRRKSKSPDRRRRRSRSPRRDGFRARRGISPLRFGRDFRRSPPRRRSWGSPHREITAGGRRLPGPERRDVMPFTPRRSPPRGANHQLTLEERDARTVFIMQIAARTRPRDLEEFFSSVGRVRDVRIITDSKTRRSKGIAYVEFWEVDAVALAIGLNGQRLLGAPLLIQPTQSEKNRAASGLGQVGAPGFAPAALHGPMKLYVGSLHFNITEDMLKGIFEPFGRIDSIQLLKETETGRSRGYGFVTFHTAEDAKRAMEQLNGFELAGRPIKVGHVTEHQPQPMQKSLDSDELDRTGVDLGTAGRLSLMAKLAEGTGLNMPDQARQVLNLTQHHQAQQITPPIATQCFMLSNMFDPTQESGDDWDQEIRDDVIEECSKNGGVLHIFVDKASPQGNVYVKCPSVASAAAAVNSLHGRWFAGKIITANYVPVNNYHSLFPDAMSSAIPLQPAYSKAAETAMF